MNKRDFCLRLTAGSAYLATLSLQLLPRSLYAAPAPGSSGPATLHTFTDDAGRRIPLNKGFKRILAAGGPAAVFAYAMDPTGLVGWPRALRDEERPFLHPSVRDLPGTGLLTGRGGEVNLELVLKHKPDLILDIGSTAPVYVDLANRLERQTGIPTVLLSGRFEDSSNTLQKLGALLGRERRAAELAAYTTTLLDDAKVFAQSIGIQERPLVYLARGADGLETATPGSINSEIIERAGGMNVLNALGPAPRSIVRVSMETLYRLNPEVIITWDKAFYQQVFQSPRWQSISAVTSKRVHLAPLLPFGWIDRPPSINRLIGIPWLQAKLFPGRFRGNLREETTTFFRLFYGVELTPRQLNALLGPA